VSQKSKKQWYSGWSAYLKIPLKELVKQCEIQMLYVQQMDKLRDTMKDARKASLFLINEEMPQIFKRDKMRIAIGYRHGYRCVAHKVKDGKHCCTVISPTYFVAEEHLLYDNLCCLCEYRLKEKAMRMLTHKLRRDS